MAVVELQFRDSVFFSIIAAMARRLALPVELIGLPPDRIIDRLVVGAVGLASFHPEIGVTGDDEVLLLVPLAVHHTTYHDARLAGSLQQPATQQIQITVWVLISPDVPQSRLHWRVARLEVNGQRMITPNLTGGLPIGGGDVTIERLAIVAGNGVVALRIGTHPTDVVTGTPVNRLAGNDWSQTWSGQVLADALATRLNAAIDEFAAGKSDIEIDSRAVGHWSSAPPGAHASVEIVAVDRIFNWIDVPVRFYAAAQPFATAGQERVEILVTLHWYAHDVITTASSGAIELVQDEVSDEILSELQQAPAGLKEVERHEDSVVYQWDWPLRPPSFDLASASVTSSSVDGQGVHAAGPMQVRPDPVGFFTLELPHWESGIDCGSRSYKTTFHPPQVHVVCADRFWGMRLWEARVEPPGLWIPSVRWSYATANSPEVMSVVFEGPHQPTAPPQTSGSSAYLNTNLGVRWVDFGNVPPKPAAPADPVGIQVQVYNQCMRPTSRWALGVLNLGWLVDPPDLLNLGRPALREWTVVAEALDGIDEVDLVAVGPEGERLLATVPVERGVAFAQVVTDDVETLQLRTGQPVEAPLPQLLQRWIAPTGVEDGREADLRPGRTIGRGRSVAVLHRGEVVVGVAGPRLRVHEQQRSST